MDDIKKRRKFDTKVQYLQYKVLREVARGAWNGDLLEKITDIPKTIIPGNVPTMRCCVYKERAIISERVKLAMGGNRSNPNVIEVIEIACDDCPPADTRSPTPAADVLRTAAKTCAAKTQSLSTISRKRTSTRTSASNADNAPRCARTAR